MAPEITSWDIQDSPGGPEAHCVVVRNGSLVATGSLAGEQGVPFNLAYASAKVRSAFVCTSPPSFGTS